ncbi:hypothetical protein OGW15_12395 [Citrobacter sp. Cf039]|uniref:hypothetical protein n=1 Tax=Citrobacter sp. Cf039 TaxID=2985044 RepID=UPI002577F61F|nr:hypothetical protein [Citrobacter sp. Cf039]MDM3265696.1 hypothetical protein [Citrobacter sp. Cf039]MEB0897545.1 hypothetical protein [Citrobacter freundii]
MSRLTAIIIALLVLSASCFSFWRMGWNAHADHINNMAAKKKEKAEKAIEPVEQKAAEQKDEGRVIYRTITRDVVRYVQDPNRTVCNFDDDAIRLRQQAIDAANTIPGFDAATMQSK